MPALSLVDKVKLVPIVFKLLESYGLSLRENSFLISLSNVVKIPATMVVPAVTVFAVAILTLLYHNIGY